MLTTIMLTPKSEIMFDSLFSYIEKKSCTILSNQEKELVSTVFNLRKLRKKQYFLQEGEICDSFAFIVKGATRMYSVDTKGNEHILKFGMEQWWIGDDESYNLHSPTRYNIDTLEDTWLLTISSNELKEVAKVMPAISFAFNSMQIHNTINLSKRLHSAISLSAEERYDDLFKTEPSILLRFPQGMIASYLGITPETLSRIKRNLHYRPNVHSHMN